MQPRKANTVDLSTPGGSILWDAAEANGGHSFPAADPISPGHVVKLINNGGVLSWIRHDKGSNPIHSTAQHDAYSVAVERPMQNRNITAPYAVGELVSVRWYVRGGMFRGLATPSMVIAAGDLLVVNGIGTTGTLKPVPSAFPGSQIEAVYQALEAVASSLDETPFRVAVIA